uniref:Reverse transcriptase Ty1/copia-type domain-containing protein n=1 Tax=Cannabis sativa TaxID=3483 RepID=A0A803NSH5_CANSA
MHDHQLWVAQEFRVVTACYLINRCPSSAIKFKTPHGSLDRTQCNLWSLEEEQEAIDSASDPDEDSNMDYELVRDRKRRAIKPPLRYGIADVVHYALNIAEVGDFEPKTYEGATRCSDGPRSRILLWMMRSIPLKETRPGSWLKLLLAERFCVYVKNEKCPVFLLLYVDDMLIASKSMNEIDKVKRLMHKEFEMKDIEIERERKKRTLKLSQSSYTAKILEKFGFDDVKPVSTPLSQQFRLSCSQTSITDEECNYIETIPYTGVLGSIMYIMVCTRPDICHGVSVESRFMSKPEQEHWRVVKWIMRYLKGTINTGLVYGLNSNRGEGVLGYVDSDYAGDLDTKISQTGYVFMLNGCTISWKANLLTIVALSTTEADYIACTEAIKENFWLKGITRELGIDQQNINILYDSQSALHPSRNQVFRERTKHIDVRLHFIQDVINDEKVKLCKVSTEENAVDMLTKNLATFKFQLF